MENSSEYLNFIDNVKCPTDGDFFDYFRIFTLLLQEEADKGRWEGIKAENFTIYDDSTFFKTEIGVKLNFLHYNSEIIIGVRFITEYAYGHFQIYSRVNAPSDLCQSDFKAIPCCRCENRTICRGLDSSITHTMHSLFEFKPDGKWLYDELGLEIGYEVEAKGYSELYHDFCLYLDWMNPITELLSYSHLRMDIETITQYNRLWNLPIPLFGTLSKPKSELEPHFITYKRQSTTIEEIINKPHGMENEYNEEEPPF